MFATAKATQSVQFLCVSIGEPVPVITWSLFSSSASSLTTSDTIRIHAQTVSVSNTNYSVSVLELTSLSVGQSDQYNCIANNGVEGVHPLELPSHATFYLSVIPSVNKGRLNFYSNY